MAIGRPDEKVAVDIRRHPLDADQLAPQFFETVIIETETEPDAAIRNAAFRNEAPEDLFQDLIKVHASAPVRRALSTLHPRAPIAVAISTPPSLPLLGRRGQGVKRGTLAGAESVSIYGIDAILLIMKMICHAH